MGRFLAGAASAFVMLTGAFLLWQSHAQEPALPAAPPPATSGATAPPLLAAPQTSLRAPEATPKSREQKRFSRNDKNKNGRIEAEELYAPRRKAFAKLDKNGNGTLSFDEWAVKTVDKFGGADRDRSGWLTPAEFATTAPKPAMRKAACRC